MYTLTHMIACLCMPSYANIVLLVPNHIEPEVPLRIPHDLAITKHIPRHLDTQS
jgi:hypothetical protein